ncbi:hypothetical protein GCM10028777_18730 [Angustibacter speluncae]
MHPRLVLPPSLARRPFTVAEGVAAGLSPDDLRSPTLRAPHRGVRVPVDLPDSVALACRAAALVLPAAAAVDGVTAAALHGFPLPRRVDPVAPLVVRVPPGGPVPRIRGVRAQVGPVAPVTGPGLRVMSPAEAWAALGTDRRLTVDDLVVVGDAVARRGGLPRLRAVTASREGGRGVRRLREALALVRERVDSPQETRTRLVLVRAGLPEPEVNLPVHAADGSGWLFRPDLRWEDVKVALEYDGRDHVADDGRRSRDETRRELAERHGWRVLVAVSVDLTRGRVAFVRRVEDVLRERGLRW